MRTWLHSCLFGVGQRQKKMVKNTNVCLPTYATNDDRALSFLWYVMIFTACKVSGQSLARDPETDPCDSVN